MTILLTGTLLVGAPTLGQATPLDDRFDEILSDIKAAKNQMDERSSELDEAQDRLAASRRQLDEARSGLERVRKRLTKAKERDVRIAAQLEREQEELRKVQAELAVARAAVEEQRQVIARAARDAFQGRTDLAGVTVLLGSESATELEQRLQWDTTIFDATAYRMDQLKELEERVAEAERKQALVEARVADKKRESTKNILAIKDLEAEAVEKKQDVLDLVERNKELKAEATASLAEDQAEYNKLMAESAKIQNQLAARAAKQLANGAPREDIARLVAAGVVSTNPATYPLASTGAQMILSRQGFIRPVKARPGSPFGRRFHPILHYWRMHNGTDFGAACGTPLYAAQSGTVVSAGTQGGFGKYVIIDHGNIGGKSLMTGYAHQSRMKVKAGQRVKMGQLIGYVGTTGLSTGCHLHLQVYRNGTPVDPMKYIP
ncbi:MAG: peptidoglycan DD-metalloendopeptidase family protein [Propioniciclava sp.]